MSKEPIFMAKIARCSVRYRDWVNVFDSDQVLLKTAISHLTTLSGLGDRRVYQIALNQLSE